MMKNILKKILPKKVLNYKHFLYAFFGALKYGFPSNKILVIGVTGTSGKSSTIYLMRQIMEYSGLKVGALTTIDFYVNGEEKLNDQKMTMLGKMKIHKYLREMVDKKCDVAIIEVTSEGVVQHRHRFINFDTVLLTNLYPEHIESHGSFENYKQAKLDFFNYVASSPKKQNTNNNLSIFSPIEKTCIVNANNEHSTEFINPKFNSMWTFGRKNKVIIDTRDLSEIMAKDIKIDEKGLHFEIKDRKFDVKMFGEHNIMNITAAICAARTIDINWKTIEDATRNFKPIPGRIEFITEAEKLGFQVIVDYAFEPVALKSLYKVVDLIGPERIIHVCGSTGGGRDKSRRIPIGKLVGEKADIFIITDEDPYDEDPVEIINAVSTGAEEVGMEIGKNLFKILDRKEAINKAIDMAESGDLILITGKGSEQAMCIQNGKMIDWDDRKIVRKAIKEKMK
ncbi:MAG: UDP-N-acetylmuramyl-tripeptide synthetase [Candidatus Magasanikbacteria bacterium]|nr:UDP-N-acetylmuramyl-tripeptide synthetase [Candidatus Magasanikbacteria bacterium]